MRNGCRQEAARGQSDWDPRACCSGKEGVSEAGSGLQDGFCELCIYELRGLVSGAVFRLACLGSLLTDGVYVSL